MLQNELAEKIDVTPAAVSQYESGAARPSPDVVSRIALALGCAPDWFYRRPWEKQASSAFFRSLRSVSQRERDRARGYALALAELFALIEEDVELPPAAFSRSRRLTPDATTSQLEEAALTLRATWGVPPGPVASVVRLLESHGAVVAAVGVFDNRLDAFSLWPGGPRPVVVLCSQKGAAARRRFDAAHELGHLLLHEHATGEHWQERQAHAFAAALMMPADEIEPWLPRRANQFEILEEGSKTWGVSMQALLFRARALRTLSDSAYQRTMRRFSAAGWRTSEPIELGPPESPVMLEKAVSALLSGGGSTADLAERFAIPEGRLRRMLSLPEDRAKAEPAAVLQFRRGRETGLGAG